MARHRVGSTTASVTTGRRLHLQPRHRRMLEALLGEHLPDVEVWAYGSRVNGRSHDGSDLDLVLRGPGLEKIPSDRLGDFEEAVRESNIPFLVEARDWAWLPERFHREIERGYVVVRGKRVADSEDAWRSVRLGDVTTKIGSGATPRGGKATYLERGPFTLIRSQNVWNNRFKDTGIAFISETQASQLQNAEVQRNDVLLNITGDSVARVCQAPDEILPARVNQHVAIVRPKRQDLSATFLRYLLVSPSIQATLLSWAGSGGTRKALTKGMLESLEVRAPSVPEQRAIAHILGTLDDKIELNRRMNETLEGMARTLFKSWFVDFDPVRAKMEGRDTGLPEEIADLFPDRLADSEMGQIPEGWEVRTFGDLCEKPQYGFTASAQGEPVGPRFLRITDINKDSWVSWSRVPHCRATDEEILKYRLSKGDVLIARMADPGHGVLVEKGPEAVFASYLIRFRPLDNRYARFFQYWMRSDAYWHLVRSRATGTTRQSLNAKVLSGFPTVTPPNTIAGTFGENVSPWRDQVVGNVERMDTLASLRHTLLPKLISGEIRVSDLETHPGGSP